ERSGRVPHRSLRADVSGSRSSPPAGHPARNAAAWKPARRTHWESVDPALGDVDEIARLRVYPLLSVVDAHAPREDVKRLGDRAVEVLIGPARHRPHLPAIHSEQA